MIPAWMEDNETLAAARRAIKADPERHFREHQERPTRFVPAAFASAPPPDPAPAVLRAVPEKARREWAEGPKVGRPKVANPKRKRIVAPLAERPKLRFIEAHYRTARKANQCPEDTCKIRRSGGGRGHCKVCKVTGKLATEGAL